MVFQNETPNGLISIVWESEQMENGRCLLTSAAAGDLVVGIGEANGGEWSWVLAWDLR